MKNLITFSSVGLILLIWTSSALAQFSQSAKKHTSGINGGFEEVSEGLPLNWLVYTPRTTGGNFDLSFDPSAPHEGKQSIKFTVRECSSKGGRYSPGLAQETPVVAGAAYRVSFWIKNEGTEFTVSVTGVNASDWAEGPKLHSSERIPAWKEFMYQYTIPEQMNRLKIEANILSPGTFWLDGITIEKLQY